MRAATLDKLIWVFIYGGLLALCLGLFVRRDIASLGVGIMIGGAVVAALGVVLVWVRSRMHD